MKSYNKIVKGLVDMVGKLDDLVRKNRKLEIANMRDGQILENKRVALVEESLIARHTASNLRDIFPQELKKS